MAKPKVPFKYFGGKARIVNKLLQYTPEHKYYAEVFGGAAALLFSKPPSEFEVYNDLNYDLFNFFQVLRDEEKFQKLQRLLCLTPYSRNEFQHAKNTIENETDDVLRAWKFFIIVRQAFAGNARGSWGIVTKQISNHMPSSCSSYLNAIEALTVFHKRIMRVQIENKRWQDIFKTYSWGFNEGFYYLDPPYLPDVRKQGKLLSEMSREEHEELIDFLITNQNKYRVMLSGYDNELYSKLERHGWKKFEFKINSAAVARTKHTKLKGDGVFKDKPEHVRVECIWINYAI